MIVALTTSGVTVLPFNYDAAVAIPTINSVVSAADLNSPAAPGGLIAVLGTNLSGTNQATSEVPLPTVINDSCLTVNGQPVHMMFVSPTAGQCADAGPGHGQRRHDHAHAGRREQYLHAERAYRRARGVSQRDGSATRPICRRSSATPTGWWSLPPIPCTAATF